VLGIGVGVAVGEGNVVGGGITVTVGIGGTAVGAEGVQAERIKIMKIVDSLFIGVLRNFVLKRPYILP
jgi:hypothetical protein